MILFRLIFVKVAVVDSRKTKLRCAVLEPLAVIGIVFTTLYTRVKLLQFLELGWVATCVVRLACHFSDFWRVTVGFCVATPLPQILRIFCAWGGTPILLTIKRINWDDTRDSGGNGGGNLKIGLSGIWRRSTTPCVLVNELALL